MVILNRDMLESIAINIYFFFYRRVTITLSVVVPRVCTCVQTRVGDRGEQGLRGSSSSDSKHDFPAQDARGRALIV